MKKALAAAVLAAAGLRLVMLTGLGSQLETLAEKLTTDGKLVSTSLNFELGIPVAEPSPTATPEPTPGILESIGTFASGALSALEDAIASDGKKDDEPRQDDTEIISSTLGKGVTIANDTSFEIDAETLMAQDLDLSLPVSGPQILIIHTHGSEAYTPDEIDNYVPTDTSRTEDTNFNVVRVGDELTAALEAYGLNVLHDREIYDYPSYSGSYSRSAEAVEAYLEQYPDIAVVIDVHRDALGTGDVLYKTAANLTGQSSAQVMMVVGTDENGLHHPQWRENLKFALALQSEMNLTYPTLARSVSVTPYRYNQHLTAGSIILEVGSSGNTLQEALTAVRLFAESAGPFLSSLVAAE